MAAFRKSAYIFDESLPWQPRVVSASLGTTTGLIVLAILAKQPKNGPALGLTCDILTDGRVVTPVRRYGCWGTPESIGTTISVRDNLRMLADHCKLSGADRIAMFDYFQKWIHKDYRAKSEI